MRGGGYSASDLIACGYTASEMKDDGYTYSACSGGGYEHTIVIECGVVPPAPGHPPGLLPSTVAKASEDDPALVLGAPFPLPLSPQLPLGCYLLSTYFAIFPGTGAPSGLTWSSLHSEDQGVALGRASFVHRRRPADRL